MATVQVQANSDAVIGDDSGSQLGKLIDELSSIRGEIERLGAAVPPSVQEDLRDSATNLLHYLALRQQDLRPLQEKLSELGLSSLGRSESHVLANVDAVLDTLRHLAGEGVLADPTRNSAIRFRDGARRLDQHTERLFGHADDPRKVRIMVTMPSEAAEDGQLIHSLLATGMDCMRINCAHDDPDTWGAMIGHLRRAEQALGRQCKVIMDLAGPKLRTGPIAPGPDVLKCRPRRDAHGRVVRPARVWLTGDLERFPPPEVADASLQVSPGWLTNLERRDVVRFRDTRNASRRLEVLEIGTGGCWLRGQRTAYLDNGIMLEHQPAWGGKVSTTLVSGVPCQPSFLHLHVGDLLVLTPDREPGTPALYNEAGSLLAPARIGCTLPEVIPQVKPGEDIWFDDGKIGGRVEARRDGCLQIRISHAGLRGSKLRADKGINLPSSELQLPALTEKDRTDLPFVARNADIVALSFANTAQDVRSLIERLQELNAGQPAIALKIETVKGFRNLPDMLLEAMSAGTCAVMIARGDLAVESGFERLAEVQEQILWLCEAAHVPVIWATQVLESLAKTGAPTRAEVTDAAMGHRAECVMLNKGPNIVETVRALRNILNRMQGHQFKKQSMLRGLQLAIDWPGIQDPNS